MKDRPGVSMGGRGIDPLVDQSAPKDQYASEMQGLPSRTREERDRRREECYVRAREKEMARER